MEIFSLIPDGWPRILLFLLILLLFVFPRLMAWMQGVRRRKVELAETKLILEIRKLALEIQRLSETAPYADEINSGIVNPKLLDLAQKELPEQNNFGDKLKYGMLGGLFFLCVTSLINFFGGAFNADTVVTSAFTRDLIVGIICGFAVTIIPWGRNKEYFLYGVALPVLISMSIVFLNNR